MRSRAVRDLQRRLAEVGHPPGTDPPGTFGAGTETALLAFQRAAGLPVDGLCGALTWDALVEAGYRLGDRQLYLRAPMMRGDDVADLQRRLGALGFDAGRVDGIFGPDTADALGEFQRNCGLPGDGIFGPDTNLALRRLGAERTAALPVALVRERAALLVADRSLAAKRVVIGEPGGLGALAQAIAYRLRDARATATTLDHPDWSVQARRANSFAADLYLGLQLRPSGPAAVAFYRGKGYESTGGLRLAELVAEQLGHLDDGPPVIEGMRLPALRETRMPAVVVTLNDPATVVARTPDLALALTRAIARWVEDPVQLVTAALAAR
jgi:N-acetylmuramoyl-L-alanine amidase